MIPANTKLLEQYLTKIKIDKTPKEYFTNLSLRDWSELPIEYKTQCMELQLVPPHVAPKAKFDVFEGERNFFFILKNEPNGFAISIFVILDSPKVFPKYKDARMQLFLGDIELSRNLFVEEIVLTYWKYRHRGLVYNKSMKHQG